MWNEPMPKWRKAQKQHQCQGEGCARIIAPGERYLDQALRHPAIVISDTVGSAPSTVITSSTVAMSFLIAITNVFPARNGRV